MKKIRTRKKKVASNYLKDILDERGIDYKWFATEMKNRFKYNKMRTYDLIKTHGVIDINDRLRINAILKISNKELLSLKR